jgi:hypothetical protein
MFEPRSEPTLRKKPIYQAARYPCFLINTLNSFAERSLPMTQPIQLTKNLGMILLAAWLIITGLISLLSLSFSGLGLLMGILAIAAGVLIALGR